MKALPPVLQAVEIPLVFNVTRLASSGDCKLKPVLPGFAFPDWPPSPQSAFGRVVHSLMDLAARGHVAAIERDPRQIASLLDELLQQEESRLAAAPVRPSYAEIRATFTAQQWMKKRHLAITRTMQISALRPTGAFESEPSRGTAIPLARALHSTNFVGSELPVESVKLRLRARLDYLKILPDGVVEVTDFKSGNVLDEEGEIEGVTALQLRLYGLLLLEFIPSKRLQLKVVSGAGTTTVSFSQEDIENTRVWLTERISALRGGEHVEANNLAVVGPQCRGCSARLVCPAYRNAVSELWKRTDVAMELPLDIAGTVTEVESSAEYTTLRIVDLAGRITKIHRLSAASFFPTQFVRDSVFWFFNLASHEARPLRGTWRHPRNFHDLPSNTLERRAWTLQAYRA
jgi:hypothetical protein